ncbi:uncharacterized protein N7511_000389 [Penicillium nucicola]|uniref:uncharacterized protein n=1 Tax=Penicillium nucicola TaxID=1850975 RepID=UPI002545787F|nr:uncharacterized protein N7511_000389 [Penicillium nucicola]KAJ5775378.1 hypothetical protein N7511_000389 [Penicillium nucicola]
MASTFVLYHYTPNLVCAVLFAALFSLTTAFHLYQRIRTHTKYFNPFIVGGIFQIIGYVARALTHFHETSTILYAIQNLFLLLAPTLYAASIYMVLGRIITYVQGEHLSFIPVRLMTKIFVAGDVLSFILQAAGGGIMSSKSQNALTIGKWVIVGGLGVQLVFFGAFVFTALVFNVKLLRHPTPESEETLELRSCVLPRDWRGLLFACYAVSMLILIRSIYRLIEFAQGNDGYVMSHEVFLYVFDAAMMFLVMFIMNVMHPSVVLSRVAPRRSSSRRTEVQLEEQKVRRTRSQGRSRDRARK